MTKAGSAVALTVLRWMPRGRAIACGRLAPRSRRSISTCSTAGGIVEPPGEPIAISGRPRSVMIVGAIELRGRLFASARLGWVAESKLKSVSSLLSRKP